MCDVISQALAMSESTATSRRTLLRGAGVAAVASAVALGAGPASAAAPRPASRRRNRQRTRLVLLGTAGGPPQLDGARYGVSTAVAFEDRYYLVDLGLGSAVRLAQSSLRGDSDLGSSLAHARAILFTHMHSDHLADWPALYAMGGMNKVGRTLGAIDVFGPGNRGTLPRLFPPGRPEPGLYNPDDPTPGITGMTHHLRNAWAADFNDRARDANFPSPDELFRIHDIDLEGIWHVDPEGRPPILDAPLDILDDGEVRITATLADHHPTAPAFAYRIETPDGSIVVSGDTGVSTNVVNLARGADFLVHEVIDPAFVDRLVATVPPAAADALREHLLSSHTSINEVGRDVAEPAGVKNLVLNHLIPADSPERRWRQAQRGFSGRLIVGSDLMELGLGPTWTPRASTPRQSSSGDF